MSIKVTTNRPVEVTDTDVIIRSPDGLTGTFTNYANGIFEWCLEMGVEADMLGKWYDDGAFSAWRIEDEQQRMLFLLRWTK